MTSAHRLDASFFGDPGNGPAGPQRQAALLRTDTAGYSELDKFGGHNQTVRYSGILKPSGWWKPRMRGRRTASPSSRRRTRIRDSDRHRRPIVRTGGIGFFENNDGKNQQFQAFSTHLLPWLGDHQLRYGVQYENIDYNNITNYSGTPFTLSNGQKTVTGASIRHHGGSDVRPDLPGDAFQSRQRADDAAGLRELLRAGYLAVPPLHLPAGRPLRAAEAHWQPRQLHVRRQLGAAARGSRSTRPAPGRMKLFANYGRFFAQIPNDLAARALSADAGVSRADYFDAKLDPADSGRRLGGRDDAAPDPRRTVALDLRSRMRSRPTATKS